MGLEIKEKSVKDELLQAVRKLLTPRVTHVVLFIALGMWLFFLVMTSSILGALVTEMPVFEPSSITYYMCLTIAVCELGVIVNRGYSSRDAYALLVTSCVSLCVFRLGRIDYLLSALLIYCARSYDVRTTIAYCAGVIAVSVLIVLACAGVGVIDDIVMDEPPRIRHCLGFLFFLNPSMYVFNLTCVVCYLRGRDITVWEGILLTLSNVLMYVLTESQTSFGLALVLLAAMMVSKLPLLRGRGIAWFWEILSWSFLIAFFASLMLTLLYGLLHGTGFVLLDKLDAMTRGRFSFGFAGIKDFGITAWGQSIQWQGNGVGYNGYNPHLLAYNYVDNMYMHLLLEEGWIYVSIYVILCTLVTRRALRDGDYALILTFAAMATYAVLNDLSMHLHFNLMMILFANLYKPVPTTDRLH